MPDSNRWGTADIRWDLMEIINERRPDIFEPMADRILPPVNVTTTSGNILLKHSGDGKRLMNIKRGERGSYKRGRNILSDTSFKTEVFGYEEPIDNMEDIEANEVLNLETTNTEIVQETLLVHKEKRVSDLLFSTATFSGPKDVKTATAVWSGASALIRKNDIWPAATLLKEKRGIKRQSLSLIMTIDNIDKILLTDDVRESVKYSGVNSLDEITRQAQLSFLATFFQIKEVIQVDSQYNSNGFDIKAEFTEIWSNSFALLAALSTSNRNRWGAGLGRQPFFGKATRGKEMIVESYDETDTDQFIIRAKHRSGETAFSDYGVLIESI